MLFAGGYAIPPGTRNLGDVINENDPCTLNPSDPICVATRGDVAADPCKLNPSDPICQRAIIDQAQNAPIPGSNDSQWNAYVDSSAASGTTPAWVSSIAAAIKNGFSFLSPSAAQQTPTLNPAGGTQPRLATSVGKLPWKPILVFGLLAVGGFFVVRKQIRSRKAV